MRVTLVIFPKAKEKIPDKDGEYLFFLKGVPPQTSQAVKVLRANDETIRATVEAIRRAENGVGPLVISLRFHPLNTERETAPGLMRNTTLSSIPPERAAKSKANVRVLVVA